VEGLTAIGKISVRVLATNLDKLGILELAKAKWRKGIKKAEEDGKKEGGGGGKFGIRPLPADDDDENDGCQCGRKCGGDKVGREGADNWQKVMMIMK
jgi:hypothetical protein